MDFRALLVVFGCSLVSCQSGAPKRDEPLRIFAASSLSEALGDLEQAFERSHPGLQVEVTFGGSQVLRTQIEQGALADVFASADETHVRALTSAQRASEACEFARNDLVIIVPRDNPAHISGLADLPRAPKIVVGAPHVPVGSYTRQLLQRATPRFGPTFERDVLSQVVSEEANVRLVRAKVELGEVDAAIVYRTDARASSAVQQIDIPSDVNVVASYHAATLVASSSVDRAQAFLGFLLSSEGQKILVSHGFTRVGP